MELGGVSPQLPSSGGVVTDSDRLYGKLIEIAENVAELKGSYEEGKRHAKDAQEQNANEHQAICEKLDRKADVADVQGWVWIQKNPRIIFFVLLICAGGISVFGPIEKLVKIILGAI